MITIPVWVPFVFLLSVMVFLALTLLWACVWENKKKHEVKFNCPPIGTDAWRNLMQSKEVIAPNGEKIILAKPFADESRKVFESRCYGYWAVNDDEPSLSTKEYLDHLDKIGDQKRPNRDGIGSM